MAVVASRFGIAGIVVRTRPADLSLVAVRLARIPGVDVHHLDPGQGRVIVTVEVPSPEAGEAQLRAVRDEPGVLTAELVFHHVDEGGE